MIAQLNHATRSNAAMQAPRICRWRDWSGTGLEHLSLRPAGQGLVAESAVLLPEAEAAVAARYKVTLDPEWRVLALELSLIGADGLIAIAGNGQGEWRDEHGASLPHLRGAIDIDISATPFTNTLPIRRLGLPKGAAEEILAVYVKLPELTLTTDRQRYTCLDPLKRYRYEAVDGSFTREIEVDDEGLVLNYPGLFRRVL